MEPQSKSGYAGAHRELRCCHGTVTGRLARSDSFLSTSNYFYETVVRVSTDYHHRTESCPRPVKDWGYRRRLMSDT